MAQRKKNNKKGKAIKTFYERRAGFTKEFYELFETFVSKKYMFKTDDLKELVTRNNRIYCKRGKHIVQDKTEIQFKVIELVKNFWEGKVKSAWKPPVPHVTLFKGKKKSHIFPEIQMMTLTWKTAMKCQENMPPLYNRGADFHR